MKRVLLPIGIVLAVGAIVGSIVLFNSCKGGDNTQLVPDPEFSSELIEDFVKNKAELKEALPDKYSAYLDFSDGVNLAYNDAETKEILRSILNSINGDDATYYSLADHKMDTIAGNPDDIFKKATDPKQYNHQAAPVRTALENIVKEGKPAILITDYEEYDGKTIHKGAFAKPYFVDWLKNDNQITFLIVNYKEKNKDKKLFFTIFDGNPNKLTAKILDAIKGKASNFEKFVMSNSNYEVKTDYLAANKGGNYHTEDGLDNVSCVQEDVNEPDRFTLMPQYKAEYYPLLASYTEVAVNANGIQNESKPFPPYSFTNFLQHIFFNFQNFAYDDVELDVKVSNAQADYNKYWQYVYAFNQEKPELGVKDNPFFDEKGNLRSEWKYAEQPLGEIKDMFDLEDNPSKGDPKAKTFPGFKEYGIAFDDEFDCTQINGANLSDLIRVDIVIKDVDDKDKEDIEKLFKWGDYDNLSESVRLALQEVRPIGKVVYTYYIKASEPTE